MADAPAPAVERTIPPRSQKYIDLVDQLNHDIPDFVENVKSVRSNLESLDLSTQDLDMRYCDLRRARSLHMFFVRKWTRVSQRRLSPMQLLAAIQEDSEHLQQEVARCQVNCQQLCRHPIFHLWLHWESRTRNFLHDVGLLSQIKSSIRAVHELLQPHLSFLSQREACFSDPDTNPDDSFGDSDAPDDEFGDDDEGYIESFKTLSDRLENAIGWIRGRTQAIPNYLLAFGEHTTHITQECEHLKGCISRWSLCSKYLCCAFRKSKNEVNTRVKIKSKLLRLEKSLKNMKRDLVEAIEHLKEVSVQANSLVELQRLHHAPYQEVMERTWFIQDRMADIIQMKHDLATLNYPSKSARLVFCQQSVRFLNMFGAC